MIKYFFSFQSFMLVNGQQFNGSTAFLDNFRRVRAIVSYNSWLSGFHPVRFPYRTHLSRLLLVLFNHQVCCFLSGLFILHTAGILNSYTSAFLFIAMSDSPVLQFIFRRLLNNSDSFIFDGFHFQFIVADDKMYIYYYQISSDNFQMLFIIHGIDTSSACNPSSNLDFIQFILRHFERFSFVKYAITLV
jgi:hypothetical protein